MDRRPSIDALLETLYHPELKEIDLSLGRMHRFLDALGNPEAHLPPVIHIAGTNGKGSLVAYLQAILQSAGLHVHRYISPHLVRFSERITLAGKEIDETALLDYLTRVQALAQSQPVTFFEATTAAAFLAFADVPADAVLLEVGMGGRFDATNVIAKPALTAITPVSMDHAEFLGDTLAKIAFEKAGILKPGVMCVVGPQEKEAQDVILRVAAEQGATLFMHGCDWRVEGNDYVPAQQRIPLAPSLAGPHQLLNAATAAACAEMLGWSPVKAGHVSAGIASAVWPARLQRITTGSLAAALPAAVELWLDGGHNESAAQALAAWARTEGQPLALVCGMIDTKDPAAFLRPLASYIKSVVAVAIAGEKHSRPASDIADAAERAGIPAVTAPGIAEAVRLAGAALPPGGRVLIGGSLYLAGRVLALCHSPNFA